MQQLCCVYTTWLLFAVVVVGFCFVFAAVVGFCFAFAAVFLWFLLCFCCGFPVIFAVCLVDVS